MQPYNKAPGFRPGFRNAQYCLNGHLITENLQRTPDRSARYCPNCGQQTISVCGNCNAIIRGAYVSRPSSISRYSRPSYCHDCGSPFPWTLENIKATKKLADESDLEKDDREAFKEALDDLSSDTPRTKLAAHRVKKIIGKAGKRISPLLRAAVLEFATEAAKKWLLQG